jgi:hypothetical protein
MLVAQQKLKENIAEYILYMFQIEDVVRAYDLDIERLMAEFINVQLPDPSYEAQYRKWYEGIIRQMKMERIEKTGHLHEIKDILVELSYLHNVLMNMANDTKYKSLFEAALPYMNEFKERSNLKDKNEIELAFHALYMKLLLRLQKKEISAATEEAFDAMRALLAYIAGSYKKMKSGDMDFLNN